MNFINLSISSQQSLYIFERKMYKSLLANTSVFELIIIFRTKKKIKSIILDFFYVFIKLIKLIKQIRIYT